MKKIKIFPLILLICLTLACFAPSAAALNDPELDAKAVLLADLSSGEILYALNAEEQRSPASLTKIMTGLLAIEAVESGQCRMEDMVTAGSDAWQGMADDSSNSNIQPGETMSYKDLLYCAVVHSANEACNILATYISGSISAFVELMNTRAAELGCTNTHFLDPNGLSNDGHYTTAYDMYLITKEAVSHPDFLTICDAEYYRVEPTNMSEAREIYNSNALISNGAYYAQQVINNLGHDYLYEGASGVKTGYTRAAGYCLVSTAERNGVNLLAVVMGCGGELNTQEPEYKNFTNTITLYDWAFDNFSYRTILSASQFSHKAAVKLAAGGGEVILRPVEDIRVLLPNDIDDASIKTEVHVYEDKLVAPIAAGTELGEVRISADGRDYGVVKLTNPTEVKLSKLEFIKQQLKGFFSRGWVITLIVIVLVVAAAYLLLVARYRALRRRHIRERRQIEAQRRRDMQQQARQRAQRLGYERAAQNERHSAPRRQDEYDEQDYYDEPDGYEAQGDYDYDYDDAPQTGYDDDQYYADGQYYADDQYDDIDEYGGYNGVVEEEEELPRTDPADLDELFSRFDDLFR